VLYTIVGTLWIPLEVIIIIFVIVIMTTTIIITTTILPLPTFALAVIRISTCHSEHAHVEWFSERKSFLETLIDSQLLQKFFAFCGTQMIITMLRRAHYRIFVIQTEPVHWNHITTISYCSGMGIF
jgi:hypothetical protein